MEIVSLIGQCNVIWQREHEEILASREDKQSGVTWEEYRHKMTFTNMVTSLFMLSSNVMGAG